MLPSGPIRPFASPWRLARRIALVTLASCFVGNAVFWTHTYVDPNCFQFCARTLQDVVEYSVMAGGYIAIFAVPAATLLFTPIIYFGTRALTPRLGPGGALIFVLIATVLGAILVLPISGLIIQGRFALPPAGVVAAVFAIVFGPVLPAVLFRRWWMARRKSSE